jgi:hypothetical protein
MGDELLLANRRTDGRTDSRTDRRTDRYDEANRRFFTVLRTCLKIKILTLLGRHYSNFNHSVECRGILYYLYYLEFYVFCRIALAPFPLYIYRLPEHPVSQMKTEKK